MVYRVGQKIRSVLRVDRFVMVSGRNVCDMSKFCKFRKILTSHAISALTFAKLWTLKNSPFFGPPCSIVSLEPVCVHATGAGTLSVPTLSGVNLRQSTQEVCFPQVRSQRPAARREYKKTVLSQRWPRNAPYIWVPWKFLGFPDYMPQATIPKILWAFVPMVPSERALVSSYRPSIVTFPHS